MPAGIVINPIGQGNSLPFGPVITSEELTLDFFITNNGNTDLVFASPAAAITSLEGANDFSLVASPDGVTVAPGAMTSISIKFLPTDATGTAVVATLQLNSNSVSGPTLLTLTGTAAGVGDIFAQITHTVFGVASSAVVNFGDVAVGVAVMSGQLVIINRTSAAIAVTLVPLSASGYAIINQSGTNPIPPTGQLTFNLQLTPAADKPNQDDVNAVVVTIAGQTYVTNFEATYNTQPINPAFPIGGTDFEMLLGFFNASGQVAMLQADASNLQCEEAASFSRQYDFKMPTMEKQLERLLLRYERMGPAIVSVTYTSISPLNQSPVTQTRTFDATADNLLRSILYDGSIAGEILEITFSCEANEGPVSIALFTPYFEPRGEYVEAT